MTQSTIRITILALETELEELRALYAQALPYLLDRRAKARDRAGKRLAQLHRTGYRLATQRDALEAQLA